MNISENKKQILTENGQIICSNAVIITDSEANFEEIRCGLCLQCKGSKIEMLAKAENDQERRAVAEDFWA